MIKKTNKSQQTKRQKYVEKVINEFTQKGWELKKAFGRASANKFIKSEKAYEELKQKVKQARSYYKERETIKKEIAEYDKKLAIKKEKKKIERQKREEKSRKKANTKNEKYLKQQLLKFYGNKNNTANSIWRQKDNLKLTMKDFESFESIQEKIVDKVNKDLTVEITIQSTDEGAYKRGAFFKNVHEEKFVKDMLNQLKDRIRKDKNAIHKISNTMDYLYNDLVILYYKSQSAKYSKFKKADKHFWEDVGQQLITYYDNL